MKRDNKGRFEQGNDGGPGRPKRQTEFTYMYVLMEACDPDSWEEVVAGAVQAAKEGDAKARDWLSKYLLGEPQGHAPTPTCVHLQELSGLDPVLLEERSGIFPA